jgi:hypothetical protein
MPVLVRAQVKRLRCQHARLVYILARYEARLRCRRATEDVDVGRIRVTKGGDIAVAREGGRLPPPAGCSVAVCDGGSAVYDLDSADAGAY